MARKTNYEHQTPSSSRQDLLSSVETRRGHLCLKSCMWSIECPRYLIKHIDELFTDTASQNASWTANHLFILESRLHTSFVSDIQRRSYCRLKTVPLQQLGATPPAARFHSAPAPLLASVVRKFQIVVCSFCFAIFGKSGAMESGVNLGSLLAFSTRES